MRKKITKTILSSAVSMLLLASGGAVAANPADVNIGGKYIVKFYNDGESAKILNVQGNKEVLGGINTSTGSVIAFNSDEFGKGSERILKENGIDMSKPNAAITPEVASKIQDYLNSIAYPVYLPELKLENIKKLKDTEVEKLKTVKDDISKIITSTNAEEYLKSVKSGGDTEAYLAIRKTSPALSKEYSRISGNIEQLNKETTFALDADGNITLDENQGSGERYSVKQTVADIKADTTVYQNEDGSYTLDQTAPDNVRVNDAVVSLDNRTRSNTQAIQSNSRQLQEHNARLNSQQRQIRENHEEMKRAAAQSAALAGLFQPYSVGKFNATAALGGYSDKQAVAVGVGYRFNEQTAAKAGIAASDGDVSYNVGVNFEF
ncbi:YadA C-terminal domain-containing protein [Escherichia coli]|uniref:YadA C-terminal domain-containing protein n=1 Tax=Escherichia coli TaxID=562 RepID=UPI000BE50C51|nr:YadA C-terminal domain-containing protein [Escherichia coli]ELJ0372353.1 YadA-like family protein [Escherichia coli]ELJ9860463.1 YadA-like family protein [Escherichia coli]